MILGIIVFLNLSLSIYKIPTPTSSIGPEVIINHIEFVAISLASANNESDQLHLNVPCSPGRYFKMLPAVWDRGVDMGNGKISLLTPPGHT